MRYLALLKDSLIETRDRKSLYVMFIISGLFILGCGSCSFTPINERESIEISLRGFNAVMNPARFEVQEFGVYWQVDDVEKLSADPGGKGGFKFLLTVSPVDEFHRLIREWDRSKSAAKKSAAPAPALGDIGSQMERYFLRQKFQEGMMPGVQVEQVGSTETSRKYLVRVPNNAFGGSTQIAFLFGLTSFTLPFPMAMTIFLLQQILSEWIAGLGGIVIALIITAGSVPSMLQKGSVDIMLSRPVNRTLLLLSKYVGGLTFACVTSLVFIGGSWLIISLRSGIWNWGYLATAGTLMVFFAVLYSIGVLAAVLTRSTIASMVAPGLAWLLGWGVTLAKNMSITLGTQFGGTGGNISTFAKVMDVVAYALPRANDFNSINSYFILTGSYGVAGEDLVGRAGIPEIAWLKVILSSAALIAAMLSIACWRFSKRDC